MKKMLVALSITVLFFCFPTIAFSSASCDKSLQKCYDAGLKSYTFARFYQAKFLRVSYAIIGDFETAERLKEISAKIQNSLDHKATIMVTLEQELDRLEEALPEKTAVYGDKQSKLQQEIVDGLRRALEITKEIKDKAK
jgi:hypothetical protein